MIGTDPSLSAAALVSGLLADVVYIGTLPLLSYFTWTRFRGGPRMIRNQVDEAHNPPINFGGNLTFSNSTLSFDQVPDSRDLEKRDNQYCQRDWFNRMV